jgi:cobalt-zinc-cadmium efflux system membrane fusion protein
VRCPLVDRLWPSSCSISKVRRKRREGNPMSDRTSRLVQLLREQIPTLLTLMALGGVAIWGFHSEWRIPGMSGQSASSAGKDKEGAGEARAHLKPGAAIRVVAPARGAAAKPANPLCPLDETRVEFPTSESVRRAGVRVEPVQERPMKAMLSAPAEVDYDPTRVARLSSPVAGRVWRVEMEVGQRVRKGDVLVLLDAARVGDAKAEFLTALTQLDLRTRQLASLKAGGGAVAGVRIQEAEAAQRDARIRLFNAEQSLINLGLPIKSGDVAKLAEDELAAKVRYLGLPEPVVKTLDPETATSNLLPIRAPFDGVVAERQVAPGEVVDPTKTLFVVADLSRIWIVMSVRQEDADKLALAQPVAFESDGHPGEVVRGEVSWISTSVDERTRTMRARAAVDNPKEHLRARTFGTAQITTRDAPKAVVVPTEAIQREGQCRFVFVGLQDQVFQVRQVRLGVFSGGFTEILEGLRLGDVVVATGSFVLKSEVLKDRFGHAD